MGARVIKRDGESMWWVIIQRIDVIIVEILHGSNGNQADVYGERAMVIRQMYMAGYWWVIIQRINVGNYGNMEWAQG